MRHHTRQNIAIALLSAAMIIVACCFVSCFATGCTHQAGPVRYTAPATLPAAPPVPPIQPAVNSVKEATDVLATAVEAFNQWVDQSPAAETARQIRDRLVGAFQTLSHHVQTAQQAAASTDQAAQKQQQAVRDRDEQIRAMSFLIHQANEDAAKSAQQIIDLQAQIDDVGRKTVRWILAGVLGMGLLAIAGGIFLISQGSVKVGIAAIAAGALAFSMGTFGIIYLPQIALIGGIATGLVVIATGIWLVVHFHSAGTDLAVLNHNLAAIPEPTPDVVARITDSTTGKEAKNFLKVNAPIDPVTP